MGWNTTVLFINDSLGDIKKHPQQFVDNLLTGIAEFGYAKRVDISAGSAVNAASVVAKAHADSQSLIVTGGNYGTLLLQDYRGNKGHHEDADKLELLKLFANQLGYRIVKK